MSFVNKSDSQQENTIASYADFWQWFVQHEKEFFQVVKNHNDVAENFFEKLAPKLQALREGFYYLTGMHDEDTAELVLTADGVVKNVVFVEELVAAAPALSNWRFTALKPALDIKHNNIRMDEVEFTAENISFYANVYPEYPDEIDIVVVHHDLTEENEDIIRQGTYIFLDNYLGELNFIESIDSLTIVGKDEAEDELIPIAKLRDFLIWRQKEFIEKYEAVRYETEEDNYSAFEAELENGWPLFAIMNTDLLEWDGKASHPWILNVQVRYDGTETNGLPDEETYALLNELEDKLVAELKDVEGYLNIGRQTANNEREIYFACKDFRKPSKVAYQLQAEYDGKLDMHFDLYKDKYWQSFNQFNRV
jgi:hypothetical protein